MLTSTIVLIVVRLFCVQWLVEGVSGLAFSLAPQGPEDSYAWWRLMVPLLTIVLAVVAWFIAPLLARLISGSQNTTAQISGVALVDLYAFAFVFLGIYFVLSSLGSAVNSFQYFFADAASHGDFDPDRKRLFYSFLRYLITLLAGLACVFYGQRWARKLVSADKDA